MPSFASWRPVSLAGLAGAGAFVAAIAACAIFGDGWVPLVDDANFAVHESGHPLAGTISARFAVYGGTIAQLLFPAICIAEFARRRWTLSCGLSAIWLGESLLNVARYMADARAQRLPLAGFSEQALHDWNLILLRWDLLHYDTALATGLRGVAWLVVAAALVFLALRWRAP